MSRPAIFLLDVGLLVAIFALDVGLGAAKVHKSGSELIPPTRKLMKVRTTRINNSRPQKHESLVRGFAQIFSYSILLVLKYFLYLLMIYKYLNSLVDVSYFLRLNKTFSS